MSFSKEAKQAACSYVLVVVLPRAIYDCNIKALRRFRFETKHPSVLRHLGHENETLGRGVDFVTQTIFDKQTCDHT